jgi:hypothetical protein
MISGEFVMPVTQEQVQQYHSEGYTICPRVLDTGELEEVTAVVNQYVEQETAKGRRPEHLDMPHLDQADFLRVCARPAILDAVQSFIGPNVVLFASHIICKAKGDGLEVPWHQDGIYWDLEPMNVITLWLAVDDSTVENGCMRVVPRTQRLGPLEHVEIENPQTKVLHRGIPPQKFDASKAVNCEIPRGGCSFHAPWLIHGSTPNTSSKRRCGYTMRFMPPETKLLRDGPLAKWFVNHKLFLLRGNDTRGVNTYANA